MPGWCSEPTKGNDDKSVEASDAIDELHADIQTYIQDLKDLRDAQRDAKIESYETYTGISTSGYAYTASEKNSQLSYTNTQLRNQNAAYSSEVSSVASDTASITSTGKSAVTSALKTSKAKKNSKYKKALKNAQSAIAASKAVSDSDLSTIKSYSTTVYEKLYAYNLALENLETAQLEAATNYAATSSEIYANLAETYENKDEDTDNKISLYTQKASNATSASTANSYLAKVASQYDTILSNDRAEINTYASAVSSNKSTISNNAGTTTTLSKQDSSTQTTVKSYITKAKDSAKAGTAIDAAVLSKLAEYYSKGYVTAAFYQACVDFNNALAYKEQAEAQLEIDTETAKAEKAALGTEMFSNVEQEYTNKANTNQSKTNLLQAQQSTKTTRGLSLTASDYNSLISQSKELQTIYTQEVAALQAQVNANLASGYWTTSSQEYLDALQSISSYKTEIENCTTAQEEYNNALAQLPYDTIQAALDLIDAVAEYNSSVSDLKSALGEDLSEADYLQQMSDVNDKITQYENERLQAYQDYLTALASADQVYGGKTADEWLAEYNEYGTTINGLKSDLEDLKDSLRDDVYWRTFERAHDACERFASVVSGLKDLISDAMYFDDDGSLSEYGVAQVANLVSEYENARKEVSNYSADIENLNKLYAEGYYTQEEYVEKLNELQTSMLDSASSMKSAMSELVDMYKDMAQSELDALFELIDARNDALSAKKEYYDYDKTISDKTSEIATLKAQIAALEGVETAEARAKKATLEAQLAEAEEDLDDTVNEHLLEISQDALDDMKTTLQDAFDDKWDNIDGDLEAMAEILSAANDLTVASTNTINSTLNKLLAYYGIDAVSTGIDAYYASGTKKVSRNMTAMTNENGDELVVTKEGILLPLEYGDGVIPADLTDKLFDLARFGGVTAQSQLPNINIPSVDMSGIGTTVEQHYDSLINIEGSADAATVEDLKGMQKQLLQQSYDYARKRMYQDYQNAGGKRYV